MGLYLALCAALFGKGSPRPFRTAFIRLAIAWGAALAIGWSAANGLQGMASPTASRVQLAFPLALAAEIAVLFPLVAAQGVLRDRTDRTVRLLVTLPVSDTDRTVGLLLPGIAIAVLSLCLIVRPAWVAAAAYGLPSWYVPGALLGGATAALGFAYGLPGYLGKSNLLLGLAFLWLQYRLVGITGDPLAAPATYAWASLAAILCAALPILLLMRAGREMAGRICHPTAGCTLRRCNVPASRVWFILKTVRNEATRVGIAAAICLAAGAAVAWSRQPILPDSLFGLVAAIIAAALCSDIRALSRRSAPPETVALKGTRHFFVHQLGSAIGITVLALAPLLFAAIRLSVAAFAVVATQAAAGIGAGLLAGTLFAADQHDVAAQYAASLFCLALLPLSSLAGSGMAAPIPLVGAGAGIGMVLSAGVIEMRRNEYIWRKSHD